MIVLGTLLLALLLTIDGTTVDNGASGDCDCGDHTNQSKVPRGNICDFMYKLTAQWTTLVNNDL